MVFIIQDYPDFSRGIFKNKTEHSYFFSLNCHLLKSAHLVLFICKGGVDVNIAEHIKTQRKKQGLNQEELAERLDVSIKTIQRWEWGKRLPRVDELQKLAGVLGVSVEDLIRQDANDTTPVSLSSTTNSVSTLESIPETSFLVKEKDLIGNGKVVLYEGNGQRFILPATQENQAWFRSLMAGVMTKNIAATAAV